MKEIASWFLPGSENNGNPISSGSDCNACVLEKIGLAQAFVPSQPYETPSSAEQSLICGTAFAALSIPYTQGDHIRRNAKEGQSRNGN